MNPVVVDWPRPNLPFCLQIELSSACQLSCPVCPRTTRRTLSSLKPGPMDDAVWGRVLEAARVVKQVSVAGYGESLADPQCLARLEHLCSLDVWTSITTNGFGLDAAACERLARLGSLTNVNVSIDTPDADLYRELRKGSLAKALEGVRNLVAAGVDPKVVTVSALLMGRNLGALADFPAILAGLGVTKLVLQSYIDYNPELEGEGLIHQGQAAETVARVREACERAGVELIFSIPERTALELKDPAEAGRKYGRAQVAEERVTRQCCLPWEMPFIDKDGLVYVCCYASTRREAIMGSLKESSLMAVWSGPAYESFRRQILDGPPGTIPAVCRDCTVQSLGEHPLRRYAARIEAAGLLPGDSSQVRVVVRNTGSAGWTRDTLLRIATANPRDHASVYHHPDWIHDNRAATFEEQNVPSGATASLTFAIDGPPGRHTDSFQIVVDNAAWLPHTQFNIAPDMPAILCAYRVRSSVPVVGPAIAWLRRNLTSHVREAYLDPALERQAALNEHLKAVADDLARRQAGLEERLARLEEKRRA